MEKSKLIKLEIIDPETEDVKFEIFCKSQEEADLFVRYFYAQIQNIDLIRIVINDANIQTI